MEREREFRELSKKERERRNGEKAVKGVFG